MAWNSRPEGFLLVELLVIMAVSILLFGIAAHQHGLIIQTRQLALSRLKRAAQMRNVVERILSEQSARQGTWQDDETIIKWQTVPFTHDQLSLPSSLKLPSDFKLIKIEVIQASMEKSDQTLASLVTGVIDAES